MLFALIKDAIKLALILAMLFVLLRRYIRWRRPHLSPSVEQHRLAILLVLALALIAIKVSEEALTGESGPLDKSLLLFIHLHVPATLTNFFEAVTFTGSFKFFVPLLLVSSAVFAVFKRWLDAALTVASIICGGLVIYVLKSLTGRERPALWETRWYWGTSFPSGHTLETACVSMALALCLGRIWPRQALLFRVLALIWLLLVGLSRLVLGVHWPTDVMAAACIGMLLPIALQFLLRRWIHNPAQRQS